MNTNTKCICCDSSDVLALQTKLPAQIFGVTASVFKCTSCECGSTLPPPAISETYYEKNETYEDVFKNNSQLFRSFANDLLDVLEGEVEPGCKILDIACGGGSLVAAASERGYDVVGIDTNSDIVEWAKKQNRNVVKGNILDFNAVNGQYDVIVFSHILEHLEDPNAILSHCASLLSESGLILISQTNYKGFLPKYVPWLWYGWQPKEHYWHFTPESLNALASKANLGLSKLVPYSLHHSFAAHSNLKDLLGRNMAVVLSRIGQFMSKHDGFNTIYRKAK